MIEVTKACIVAFIKARNSLDVSCIVRTKTEDNENVFFKVLVKNILLVWKSCSWPIFYQMDFMKR